MPKCQEKEHCVYQYNVNKEVLTNMFQNILVFQSYYTTLAKNVVFCKRWLLFCLGMPCVYSPRY